MPFVHVVVLKLKEGTAEDQVAAIISGLHALPAAIPQIQSYRAGVDLGIDPAGCHIGIVGSFASPEDYAVYAKHEAHVGLITSLIKPNLEKRAAVQFAADGAPPGAAALTHAVLLKLKDDATAEQKTAIIEALSTLPAAIPQIRAYRVGPDAGTDPAKFDLAIVGDFEGVEEYQAYAKHEAHVGVITSLIKPNLAERVATQFAGDAPAKRQKPSGAPTHIIRFVDAESGAVCYGEVEDTSGEYTEAAELSGDPLTEVPFERTGRVARVGRLLAPVKTPNILCIGLNYMKHYEEGAKKRGIALPTKPVIFMKTTTALNSHGGEIWRPNMVGEDDALNPSPDDQSLGEQSCACRLSLAGLFLQGAAVSQGTTRVRWTSRRSWRSSSVRQHGPRCHLGCISLQRFQRRSFGAGPRREALPQRHGGERAVARAGLLGLQRRLLAALAALLQPVGQGQVLRHLLPDRTRPRHAGSHPRPGCALLSLPTRSARVDC